MSTKLFDTEAETLYFGKGNMVYVSKGINQIIKLPNRIPPTLESKEALKSLHNIDKLINSIFEDKNQVKVRPTYSDRKVIGNYNGYPIYRKIKLVKPKNI